MNTALIITTYNWVEALELCLKSVLTQSRMPEEIIIADDGSTDETKDFIKNFQSDNPHLKIIHSWQKDCGFRAAKSRNKAACRTCCEYLIYIDGDMILDKDFVKDHVEKAQKGTYLQGSRTFLKKEFTSRILKTKEFKKPSFFSLKTKNNINSFKCKILSKLVYKMSKNCQKGTRSCNFSFFKEELLKVNGFNENFVTWGREDSELVTRFYNVGIERKNLKFAGIQYHLYHKEGHTNSENDELLKKTIDQRLTWCENGMDKYLRGKI